MTFAQHCMQGNVLIYKYYLKVCEIPDSGLNVQLTKQSAFICSLLADCNENQCVNELLLVIQQEHV